MVDERVRNQVATYWSLTYDLTLKKPKNEGRFFPTKTLRSPIPLADLPPLPELMGGYQDVLGPMYKLSALFHEKIDPLLGGKSSSTGDAAREPLTRQYRYRNALLHNLLLQSSDFRYWGQGAWTDYAREIYRRGESILSHDF